MSIESKWTEVLLKTVIILDEKLAITILLQLLVNYDNCLQNPKESFVQNIVVLKQLFDQRSIVVIKNSAEFVIAQCLEYILVNSNNHKANIKHDDDDAKKSDVEVLQAEKGSLKIYAKILENLVWFMKSFVFFCFCRSYIFRCRYCNQSLSFVCVFFFFFF